MEGSKDLAVLLKGSTTDSHTLALTFNKGTAPRKALETYSEELIVWLHGE